MSKYYTPEIEEFHVGFQFEYFKGSVRLVTIDFEKKTTENATEPKEYWIESIFTGNELNPLNNLSFNFKTYLENGSIRVKYLDREDIESLGFIPIIPSNIEDKGSYEPDWWSTTKTGDGYQILKCKNYSTNEITYEISYGQHEYRQVKFDGTIKNKSELKKLLKQLGI